MNGKDKSGDNGQQALRTESVKKLSSLKVISDSSESSNDDNESCGSNESPVDPKLIDSDGKHIQGVENPWVIDLINPNRDDGKVELFIYENRNWGIVDNQLHQLSEKFNSYLSYILDGHLAKQYPQYAQLKPVIILKCAEKPQAREEKFLSAFRGYLANTVVEFRLITTTEM